MNVHLPSTASLRAFEAAARHHSFTRAANELHITQSAVSHQIKYLEDVWQLTLFRRLPRSLELTAAGETLLPIVRDFFQRLEGTLSLLHVNHTRGALRMRLPPSIAAKWLVPRLSRFEALYPEVSIWLTTQRQQPDALASGVVDAAFQVGVPDNPVLAPWFLMHEFVYPVACPDLVRRLGMPATARDLVGYPLLLRLGDDVAAQWEDWFETAGVPPEHFMPALLNGSRYTESVTLIEAALSGQGVALVRSAAVWDDLISGRLIRLLHVTCPFKHASYFVCRRDRSDHPPIKALRDWLMAEATLSQAAFERLEDIPAIT